MNGGNNYPNDYENKSVVDSTAKEVNTGDGNFSGQNAAGYHTGYGNTNNANTNNAYSSPASAGDNSSGSYSYGSSGNNYGGGHANTGNYYGSTYSGSTYGSTCGAGEGNTYRKKKDKKLKSGSGYFKKALAAVSLGLFFGICAGLGFFAVESVTGAIGESSSTATAEALPRTAGDIANNNVEGAEAAADKNDSGAAVVLDVRNVVKKAMPAIVSINNTYTQTMSYFGQTLESEETAAGSGIIVGESDSELLIVSNYHVVQEADKLIIQFVDGTEAEAQMKGSNPDMDLAVIAVSLDNVGVETRAAIAVAALGDSDNLTVGEPSIAIGNALGYGQSVTVGVVSALDRVIDISSDGSIRTSSDSENAESFIQTDAAINPGNSGGALLNLDGEVIGINSNKIGGTAIEGMGYAIPISSAKPIIEELMLRETRTKVSEEKKGYLGISQLTVVADMAEAYGMPKGVYVSQVYEGTGAEAAGIVKGNIITDFDGNQITSSEDLLRVLEYYSQGDSVEVTVMQGSPQGWESKTVTVTLGSKFE